MKEMKSLLAVYGLLVVVLPAAASPFTDPAQWNSYDPGANGVGVDPDGFQGGAFDGKYIYFAPSEHDRNVTGGEILRFDTTADFSSIASWTTYDPGPSIAYDGAVFVDGYVYFSPVQEGASAGTQVLRYDTAGSFTAAGSWDTFDVSAIGAIGGYRDLVVADSFIYFVPNWDGGQPGKHGQVLRYDTTAPFNQALSWETMDPNINDGYFGAVVAGDYVYFVAHHNGTDYFAQMLRYNTTLPFDDLGSWDAHTPSGQAPAPGRGYAGGVFDGAFVYFLPMARPETNTVDTVLRYDVSADFTDDNSWDTVEAPCVEGFTGAVYDGQRYIYLTGGLDAPATGIQVQYDTLGPFEDSESWVCFDPGESGVGDDPEGYMGALFDGRFVYFVPWDNGSERHGEVLRFDTHCQDGPNLVCNGDFELGNTCFTSEYNYTDTDLAPGTTYAVTSDPDALHWMDLCDYGDHTMGTGLMMAVNSAQGDDPTDLTLWTQTMPVRSAQGYSLSLWVSTWSFAAPAHLHVLVNDVELGELDAADVCGEWQQFAFNWYSGTAATAELRIYSDLNGGADFALDDISFHATCETDCNGNGVADVEDVADCSGAPWCSDCNDNGIPDECDIADCTGASSCDDCNHDGVPDGCETDCDGDGLIDDCDPDIDNDGVLNDDDVCDYTPAAALVEPDGSVLGDVDGDCDVDLVDFGLLQSRFTGPGCSD